MEQLVVLEQETVLQLVVLEQETDLICVLERSLLKQCEEKSRRDDLRKQGSVSG